MISADPSQPYPQLVAPHLSWQQLSPLHQYPSPTIPPCSLTSSQPPRHVYDYPSIGQPPLQPQSSVQTLSQELAGVQRRLSQYTDLISHLYAELELMRNLVCQHCKERISSATAQHPSVFELQIPGSQQTPAVSTQTNLLNIQLASPIPSYSPVTRTIQTVSNITPVSKPIEISLPPKTSSLEAVTREVPVIAKPITEQSWSFTYNSEIEKGLDITFLHVFKHTPAVRTVRFSPDGKFLVAGLGYHLGRLHIYDMTTLTMRCILEIYHGNSSAHRATLCVCFSKDGRYLVVGDIFQRIHIWDILDRRVLAAFKGHTEAVWTVDVSPNGRLLASGSDDHSVRIWKMRDGSSKLLFHESSPITSVMFSPNGRYVAASSLDKFLRIWDVRSGELVAKWNGHSDMTAAVFSPSGEELVSSWNGGVKSWDVSSLKVPTRSGLSTEEGGMLALINEKLEFRGHPGDVRTVAISPNGKWVMTGSTNKGVCIWDMHTAELKATLDLDDHVGGLWAVSFCPIGKYVAVGGRDGSLMLWRYKTL